MTNGNKNLEINKSLEILHDHYKETFAYIREREKQRDRLFLIAIGLLGLLFLEVQFPSEIQTLLQTIKSPTLVINISILPVSIITSVTWTILLILVLRHCQVSITIERQYKYLHKLEDVIGGFFQKFSGDAFIYHREGKAYLKNYPVFSKAVWIFYTILFPLIVIAMEVVILHLEIGSEAIKYYYVFDILMGGCITFLLSLYRGPQVIKKVKEKYRKDSTAL